MKYKTGDIVRVKFLDHCLTDDVSEDLAEAVAYGEVIETGTKHLKLGVWLTEGFSHEYFCIILAAITDVDVLEVSE